MIKVEEESRRPFEDFHFLTSSLFQALSFLAVLAVAHGGAIQRVAYSQPAYATYAAQPVLKAHAAPVYAAQHVVKTHAAPVYHAAPVVAKGKLSALF